MKKNIVCVDEGQMFLLRNRDSLSGLGQLTPARTVWISDNVEWSSVAWCGIAGDVPHSLWFCLGGWCFLISRHSLSSCWFLFLPNMNPQSTHSRGSVKLCCVHVSLPNPHTGLVVPTLVFFTWSPSSVTSTWCGWKLIFLYCYWCSWFLPLVLLWFNGSLVLDVRIHADPFLKRSLMKTV